MNHRVLAALATGVFTHGLFVLAVASMAFALASGMQAGSGRIHGAAAVACDALLLLQFPILHSALLTRRGRRLLVHLSPFGHGRTLAPSTYVQLGALQLLATFWLWTPSGVVWHRPEGLLGALQYALFGGAWLLLVKALHDAGLPLQTGAAGWWALLRDRPVDYGELPTRGLFAVCRQPIYLGFAAVLCTAPTWSPDALAIALTWTGYCVVGPLFKEARWEAMYGPRFREYRRGVPYLLPRLWR